MSMRSAAYVVTTGTLRGRSRSFFQICAEQKAELSFSDYNANSCMLEQRFTTSRIVKLSSEGASEVVSMLKSIGSSENGPDECVCKTTEA